MCPGSCSTPAPWNMGPLPAVLHPPAPLTPKAWQVLLRPQHRKAPDGSVWDSVVWAESVLRGSMQRCSLPGIEGRQASGVLSPSSEWESSCLKSLSEYSSAGHTFRKANASRVGSHHLGRCIPCFCCRGIHLPSRATLEFGCPLLALYLSPKTDPFSFHVADLYFPTYTYFFLP